MNCIECGGKCEFNRVHDNGDDIYQCQDCSGEWADWELRDFWAVNGSENPTEPFMPVDDPDTIIFRRGEG